MGIECKRPRHAATERACHHEIQRRYVREFVADNLTFDNTGEMRPHPRAGNVRKQQRIMLRVKGDDRDVGGVALVAGTGMGDLAQLHPLSPPTNWIDGFANSRGSSTDATA